MARFIYQNVIRNDSTGTVDSGATVIVYLAGTATLATIYSVASGGSAIAGSQIATNAKGYFKFYVDDGDYPTYQLFDLNVTKSGASAVTYENIHVIESTFNDIITKGPLGDVRAYGAVGDGTTDDTAAINTATAALDALGGGTLFFPDGTYIISDDLTMSTQPGIKMYDNINILGASRHGTVLKMKDNALSATMVIRINGGSAVTWHTSRITNCSVKRLTIDGNRANHTRTTVSDGVTTASSNTVTSASAPFTSGMVGDFIYLDRNKTAAAITNITPSGSSAIIESVGHDFKVGDLVLIQGIVGTGDYASINNNNFGVTAVTKYVNEQVRSFTITKTISTGAYTSGGTAYGGKLGTTITTFNSSSSVDVAAAAIATTVSNGFIIEDGEIGDGISIQGADNIVIEDVTIKNCWGDGIYIDREFGSSNSTPSTNINILNVDCNGNRRQGLSVVSGEYINVDNSWFRNTGIDGVGPGAGIDLEPDANNRGVARYINISNSFMIDNNGPGFTCTRLFADTSGTPLVLESADNYGTGDVSLTNCHIYRNNNCGISNIGCNEGIIVDKCFIKYNRRGGIRLRGNSNGKYHQQQKILNSVISWNQWYKGTVGSSDPDDENNGHGIVMANGATDITIKHIYIAGNTIEYNDGHGIYSSGQVTDDLWIVTNISIVGNGQEINNTYSNIKVEGDQALGLYILYNKINKGAAAANQHPYGVSSGYKYSKYGIEVTTSSTYDSEIIGNRVETGGETATMSVNNMLNDTAGGKNRVHSNYGFKTDTMTFSNAQNSATTGTQTTTINHNMDITPLLRNITLSIVDDIDGTPMSTLPIFNIEPYVSAISSTQVTVKWNIGTGGVGNFIINMRIMSTIYD